MNKLKGENQLAKFEQSAKNLLSQIVPMRNVAGIVLLGGLTRGFVDKSSDLDITIYLKKEDKNIKERIHEISKNEEKKSNIEIDLEIHRIEDFKKRKFNEMDRWEFSKAQIAFDPKKEIEKTLNAKLRTSKDFWIKRIAVCSEYLKWYCCPPREGIGTISEAWIERGNLTAAHHCLNYSIDLIIELMFALNREFLPPPKWSVFYSYKLKWLPEDYEELINEAMKTGELSITDLNRRLAAIRKIWHRSMTKIEDETGFTPELISKYFVRKVLHQ